MSESNTKEEAGEEFWISGEHGINLVAWAELSKGRENDWAISLKGFRTQVYYMLIKIGVQIFTQLSAAEEWKEWFSLSS